MDKCRVGGTVNNGVAVECGFRESCFTKVEAESGRCLKSGSLTMFCERAPVAFMVCLWVVDARLHERAGSFRLDGSRDLFFEVMVCHGYLCEITRLVRHQAQRENEYI
jgi:hypothetical protein